MTSDLDEFIKVLRLAYSGELAAAYAYRGHWRSVEDQASRSQIYNIEQDEWHLRNLVGAMLDRMGANPSRLRRDSVEPLFVRGAQHAAALVA
ncbi:MAG TPA: hypothetical protein VKC34_14830 [Blastocatellia bacterium]|nr:hypothetical protein [Blastocatellia bacterium]